jgi:2-methylcitrate dehydratase PrpD
VTHTRVLADYAAGLRFDRLPQSTIDAAKRITLDLIGVVFPAQDYGPGRIMNQWVREQGGRGSSTVIGTDIVTSAPQAALANGTMAADMEQDDVHPESGMHPSSVFVPALLAVAEDVDASGQAWLTSLVVAYDVGTRLGSAMGCGEQYSRGFHPTAVCGTFGAAAGCGNLMGLDPATMESAIGLTGCQAAGLLTWEQEQEHFTKSFQSGIPARNAVTAVQLAARGYIGADGTLDGRYNVFDAFTTHRRFDRLVEGLGSVHEIEATGYKFYSVCRDIHATLDVLFELMGEHDFTADDIEGMTVHLSETAAPRVDNNELTTHNLQHCVAAAAYDGEVTRVQTSAERRADPVVKDLAARIELLPDSDLEKLYPEHWPARVAMRLRDGRVFEVERDDPRGTPTYPVTDRDIRDKFLQMATQVVPEPRAKTILEVVDDIENSTSIRELTALLRVDGSDASTG